MRLFCSRLRRFLPGLAFAVVCESTVICGLLIVCGSMPAFARQNKKAETPPAPRKAQAQGKRPPTLKQQQNADAQLERFLRMPPEDRENALAKLPPQRRQQVEQRLQRLERLTPDQRLRVEHRLERLRALPPERQFAVRDELQNLRSMRPVDRRAYMNSPEFSQKYSPEEQELLRDSVGPARNGKQ